MLQLSQEFSSGGTRLRVDVHGSKLRAQVLDELAFLAYRLASVEIEPMVTCPTPDVIWDEDAVTKSIRYDGRTLFLDGGWLQGEVQKVLVSMLALRMEQVGLHPFHSSAIRYHDCTVLFMSGEANHGKTMAQIEGSRRGGVVVSTETTVTDERGWVVTGSKTTFLKTRSKGTERSDIPDAQQGAAKFFDETPRFVTYDEPCDVDLVVLPAIDGNFDPHVVEMSRFEKEYQTYHSLVNYHGLHQLLAPGLPMPIIDTDELRLKRADFGQRFAVRPYYLIRAANPQVLMDKVEELL
ncbi:MAG: hypothetical protein JXM73_21020 [Anaerolineae bacterium]|nr:hypothetical protein [Anaerolineae bacterium]